MAFYRHSRASHPRRRWPYVPPSDPTETLSTGRVFDLIRDDAELNHYVWELRTDPLRNYAPTWREILTLIEQRVGNDHLDIKGGSQ